MKKLLFFLMLLINGAGLFAQAGLHSTWIWYPGDYEIWLHKELSLRRTQRKNIFPPFYRLDAHYGNIKFFKEVKLAEPETVYIKTTGQFSVQANWEFIPNKNGWFTLPKGEYQLSINVVNYDSLPSIFIKGKTVNSDSSWLVTAYNGKDLPVGYDQFNSANETPFHFPFYYQEIAPASIVKTEKGFLIDFGKEEFGYLKLRQLKGAGSVDVYYGESKEEALSSAYAEIHDSVTIPSDSSSYTFANTRGLRYVHVVPVGNLQIGNYSLLYEFLPVKWRGSFRSSSERLNKIWDVAAYTLHLTSREFMLDGIKRDRWVWGGDARQSFLMNYYLFFDKDVNKRTLIALRGKDPVELHINKIPGYSMYWFISLYEYYLYTGDESVIKLLYPRMKTLLAFCDTRLNQNNFFQGKENDWLYLDWSSMDMAGELSTDQVLYAKTLEAMATCARLMQDTTAAVHYVERAEDLKKRTVEAFWNDSLHAFVHNRKNNRQIPYVTRYPNMFAVLFNYLEATQKEAVKKYVLTNDSVQRITTPYMRFYELAALCELGEHRYVTNEILNYWGDMLDLGATTFWEVYNPAEKGAQHYAMYGHPFERSLCHAWGAGPVFLLGKYYLGVQPLTAGYRSYSVEPHLGGLNWIEGTVPAANGDISVFMDRKEIRVKTALSGGMLTFKSKSKPKSTSGAITPVGDGKFQVALRTDRENLILYTNTE
jgi:alpha-L-rhamnosidase